LDLYEVKGIRKEKNERVIRSSRVAVYATGVIFDTGPLDVQRVVELSGQGDILKLELKRVG
jgi:hypothetical protein